MDNFYDLIIIGAGSSGLGAARVFLEYQPQLNLLIIDSNSSIGGVWAKESVHPSFKTNNLRGTNDFSDFPVGDESGVKAGENVPGIVMHEYLSAYARKWNITNSFLFDAVIKVIEKANCIGGKQVDPCYRAKSSM